MFSYILSLLHDFRGVYDNYAWHLSASDILHDTWLSKRRMFFSVAVMLFSAFFLKCPPLPLHEVKIVLKQT